jgi:hypothetical protein
LDRQKAGFTPDLSCTFLGDMIGTALFTTSDLSAMSIVVVVTLIVQTTMLDTWFSNLFLTLGIVVGLYFIVKKPLN